MDHLTQADAIEGSIKKVTLIEIVQAIREMKPRKAVGPS